MNWIDIGIIGLIGFSSLRGFFRGFLKEVLSLLVWLSAFFIAKHFHASLAMYLSDVQDLVLRNSLAMAALLMASLIVGALVNHVILYFFQNAGLSWIDRLMSVFLGAVRGVLIVSVIIFFLSALTSIAKTRTWQTSEFVPHVSRIVVSIF